MNEEIKLTNVMLEAAAVASVKWPRSVSCRGNYEYSPQPGCG
jgi:hypothetical protein